MLELNNIIATLQHIGAQGFAAQIAAKAAIGMQAEAVKMLSASCSPDGKPWALKKAHGKDRPGLAYAKAAQNITTAAHGNLIRMTLKGPYVFGHFGFKTAPPRPMLPDAGGGVPESVSGPITEAAREVLAELTR